MKLETFFEKFDEFVDVPVSIGKIRQLVLKLAVRGMLVPQHSTDEPVSTLLSSIAAFKKEFFSSKKLCGPVVVTPISPSESQSDLPVGWVMVRLGDVTVSRDSERVPISSGERISRKKTYDYYGASGVIDKIDGYLFDKPLLLIGEDGANLINRSTPIAFIARGKYWVNNHAHVLDCLNEEFMRFLELHINAIDLVPYITGTAQPKMNQAKMNAIPIALPPMAEQERIVAKVDELMALCDRLEAQQKERETRHAALTRAAIARFEEAPTPSSLKFLFHDLYSIAPGDLRKTILRLAISGGFALDSTSSPVVLGDVVKLISGQHLLADEQNTEKHGIPYLTGPADFGVKSPIPSRWTETPKVVAEPGDILITVKGAGVGKTNKLETEKTAISRQLMAVRAIHADPDFIHLVLMNAANHFQSLMTGIAIPGIGRSDVLGLEFELPSLPEQGRIVQKVEMLMSLVGQLETQLAASKKTAKDLLDAVVHELLHPTADVIEFPHRESDRASERAAIGCYAIEHLLRNPSFGHTMNMKVVYMAQAHIGLPLDLTFLRQAAGPWHRWIEEFDAIGRREGWFTVTQKSIGDGHTKYEYAPKAALKQKAAEAAAVLGEHRAEFDRLLSLFADMKTVDAEIVATLFAAWNDFLIDGKTPTDDEIIREVRTNWHESKKRFTPDKLAAWLKWMRKNRLIPQGCGPRTQQQLSLALN